METKICSKCGKTLDIILFSKGKINKDGLNVWCKGCCSIVKKEYKEKHKSEIKLKDAIYRENNKEAIKSNSKLYRDKHRIIKIKPLIKEKKCHVCKTTYPADDTTYFYKKNSGKYGLATICKKCFKIHSKKYYIDNTDDINNNAKQYRIKNIEKSKAYSKAFHKIYDKTEKGRNIKSVAWEKRRAFKLSLDNSLSTRQWEQIIKDFDYECAYCGKKNKLTIEHFIPISKLGEGTINNIIPSCQSCNSSKGNRDFFIWYPKQKYFSKKRETKLLKYLNYSDQFQQLPIV